MTRRRATTITACALLGLAAVLWVAMPSRRLPVSMGSGDTPPDQVVLSGIARDFQSSHPDFQALPPGGVAQIAGLVRTPLGSDGRPVFEPGAGRMVLSPARDAAGNPIAPHLANKPCEGVITDFEIVDGTLVPGMPFAAQVSVLGAAITSSGSDIPVTVQVRIGSTTEEPFGPFGDAAAGDVNDSGNPRHAVFPPTDTYPAGTPITVAGSSWLPDGGGFNVYLSSTSDDSTGHVLVLRNGDSVPNIEPYDGQDAIESFLTDYIDLTTGTVTLQAHQAIFLFELGTTNLGSAAADFQDLVVLISLATSTDAFQEDGTVVVTDNLTDTAAVLDPTPTDGAISSAESFAGWFADRLGVNMSASVPITLYRTAAGTWVFDDTTDPDYSGLGGFFPLDGRLFGNEGGPHNDHFTWTASARFQYDETASQFIEYTGTGDLWIHVNESLCIDLGGVHGALRQRIDLGRLCLTHGQTYTMKLFMAQRYAPTSRVRIETNVLLQSTGVPTVTNQYD